MIFFKVFALNSHQSYLNNEQRKNSKMATWTALIPLNLIEASILNWASFCLELCSNFSTEKPSSSIYVILFLLQVLLNVFNNFWYFIINNVRMRKKPFKAFYACSFFKRPKRLERSIIASQHQLNGWRRDRRYKWSRSDDEALEIEKVFHKLLNLFSESFFVRCKWQTRWNEDWGNDLNLCDVKLK